ncbi:hypothetical protein MCAP1_000534 [Malassezia caprae]|uniref:SYO1-like TPR repeats domain-containing protein n=1 Tax=Malassezia caprae TaxID=1381934 RepID=A0AAF0E6H3_9BASI|nr:hypothetical protein MCAP1_000534 [Malassezia caprae]
MPKVRPVAGRRAQRAQRHNPLHRPQIEVQTASVEQVVPALAKLGTGPDAPPVDTGDKVWALASVSTLLADDHEPHRRLLLSHQVVGRVLYALESDTNLEVRREASGALRNLCLSSRSTDTLGELANKRAIEIVLQVLRWAALGLQSHERRLERTRAPLLAERERLRTKPVEQMNRKERRLAAKLAQGRVPDAAADAMADFDGDDAEGTLDVHGWGADADASLAGMGSVAAQCLVEMCESLVTVLACFCETSDKFLARVLQWDWHEPRGTALAGEALCAWLCQAVHLGAQAASGAPSSADPACAVPQVALGIASAQALGAITDEESMAHALAGLGPGPTRAPMPTPAQLREARERGAARLAMLADAAALLQRDAAPRPAMLGAAAGGVLVNVLRHAGDEDAPILRSETLSAFVHETLLEQLVTLLAPVSVDAVKDDTVTLLEMCLELVADVASVLGAPLDALQGGTALASVPISDEGLGDWVVAQCMRSPLVETLLRLATPHESSAAESDGALRRAIETRALAALQNLLLRVAHFAPPPPSQWPEDDEEMLQRIALWRAWAGTSFLDGADPAQQASDTGAMLRTLWDRVFAIAAHWASVDSVANAAPGTSGMDVSVAQDGLAMVDAGLGVLWALARVLEGQLPLTQDDDAAPWVSALAAAYDSAQDASVRVKSIGALACLARSQYYRVHGSAAPPPAYGRVYAELASFWLQVAAHVPDADTLTAVLNAIVDTYANETAPWDSVYAQVHMQSKLKALVPSLSAIAKRVDRHVDAPLYAAAMESVQNLRAFLDYRASLR